MKHIKTFKLFEYRFPITNQDVLEDEYNSIKKEKDDDIVEYETPSKTKFKMRRDKANSYIEQDYDTEKIQNREYSNILKKYGNKYNLHSIDSPEQLEKMLSNILSDIKINGINDDTNLLLSYIKNKFPFIRTNLNYSNIYFDFVKKYLNIVMGD